MVGGVQHVADVECRTVEVVGQNEGKLNLQAKVAEVGGGNGLAGGEHHGVGQEPRVGGVDAHSLLHGPAGEADLVADHPLAPG